jgi:hypothetical protein
MADPMGLDVRNINLREQVGFNSAGAVVTTEILTFYVGTHGPFYHYFDPAQVTPTAVAAVINAKVTQLRAVVLPGQYGPQETEV